MKKSINKDTIKILLFNTLFLNNNDDDLILKNLFDFIDSMNDVELKKTKILLEKFPKLKSLEKRKGYNNLDTLEIEKSIRFSTVFIIYILFSIVEKERNEDIRSLINKYIEQKNYRHFTHLYTYTLNIDNILYSINKEYQKKRFSKLIDWLFNNKYNN
ncbi:MAG: hypothetical protein KTQ14_06605 [Fusobacteriaceae bacterium]|jgi:hypothetical protein|nr:hypothetical protein [Fusobacteriaceae bacterium]